MKKIVVFFLIFTNCSIALSSSDNKEEATTTKVELSKCKKLELDYTNLSNELFNSSFELNIFIDEISPANVDEDRTYFFENLNKNWNYQETYLNYLEVRSDVYSKIYALYANNTDCPTSGDQEISLEQVELAKSDLEDFKKKYNN